jgi:chitinase
MPHSKASLRHLATTVLASLLLGACASPSEPREAGPPSFVYSPYKDITLALAAQRPVIATALHGDATPIVREGVLPREVTAITWAFASGECGAESWDTIDAQAFADANVQSHVRAGLNYIVSTGGEAASFSCGSDEGMERFIARYQSPNLVGIDFDIERGQKADALDAIVLRVLNAQRRHSHLRFSFTLATFAASDGSRRSLNATGELLMNAIKNHGLQGYFLNLMVMDYGDAKPENCLIKDTREAASSTPAKGAEPPISVCDMGQSALQAGENAHAIYAVPLDHIELTAMIGVNDIATNVFTLGDAATVAHYARERRLGGLHYWSLDRDRPCQTPITGASSECSSLADVPVLGFARAFAQ